MFFTKYRDRRAKKKAGAIEAKKKICADRLDEEIEDATKKVEHSREMMFITACPIEGGKCFNKCVHFDRGSLGLGWYPPPNLEPYHYPILAKCRLWGKS